MRARPLPFCVIAGVICAAGCSSDEVTDSSVERPTLVEVSPAAFLGGLPCSEAPGAVRRYVATLTDVTPTDDAGTLRDFVLPSSGPLPCTQPVGFSFVVPGRKYVASIDAYDRSDIQPLAPGSRDVVDFSGKTRVVPRWTAACETPVTAVASRIQPARGCSALADSAPSGTTAVRVGLEQWLGDLECGELPGQIARYTAELAYVGASLPRTSKTARCGETLSFGDLEPGRPISISILAFEGEALEPSWGTACEATTAPLVTLDASCAPLTTLGAVEIDLPRLLAELEQTCSVGLRVRATLPLPVERVIEVFPPACESPLQIAEIDTAELGTGRDVVVRVEVFAAGGRCAGAADCAARVLPGRSAATTCAVDESCGLDGT
jgi:hypothetical protein